MEKTTFKDFIKNHRTLISIVLLILGLALPEFFERLYLIHFDNALPQTFYIAQYCVKVALAFMAVIVLIWMLHREK